MVFRDAPALTYENIMSHINKLLEIEKEYKMYECQINGVYYWAFSRFVLLQ